MLSLNPQVFDKQGNIKFVRQDNGDWNLQEEHTGMSYDKDKISRTNLLLVLKLKRDKRKLL